MTEPNTVNGTPREREEADPQTREDLDQMRPRDEADAALRDETDERRDKDVPIFDAQDGSLNERWDRMQMGFVDDPAAAVKQARALVLEAVEAVRGRVEADNGAQGDTEELRQRVAEYHRIFAGLTS